MDVIRTYVTGAFAGVAQTPAALEQQAELIANMEEKVRDLVAEGKGDQEALGITIAEAGDLSALASEFPSADSVPPVPLTIEVRIALRTLLVRMGAVTVALMALILWTVFVLATADVRASALLLSLLAVGAAGWRIWSALAEYGADPDALAEVPRPDARSLGRPVLVWFATCFVILLANMAADYGFWAWVGWCVAFVVPVEAVLEVYLTRSGAVAAQPERVAAAEGAIPVAGTGGAASTA
jgi:hypothetical protein